MTDHWQDISTAPIVELIAQAKLQMCEGAGGGWAECWQSSACCKRALADSITDAELWLERLSPPQPGEPK